MANATTWKDVFEAAVNNDLPAISNFLKKDKTLIRVTNKEEKSLALVAAENSNFKLLKYLLEQDQVILYYPDIFGNTILHRSIENGCLDMVKYLVEHHNWDVSRPNQRCFGNTPIHVAAEEGKLEILKYLIEEKHGDVNIRNAAGEPPAFLAADKPFLSIIKYLYEERSADLKAISNYKCNILFQSAKRGDLVVPKYLLDEKKINFDINWQDHMNCTIVYTAARYNNLPFIGYMVKQHNADVNIADELGRTPLHVAAQRNNFPMCKYLVEHGANVTAVDIYGSTPMKDASEPELVIYLAEMSLKRSRRSAIFEEKTRVPQNGVLWTLNESSSWPRALETEGRGTLVGNINSIMFNSFITVADAIVRYAQKSVYRKVNIETMLSPQELLHKKMDQLAIDTIDNLPDFDELPLQK